MNIDGTELVITDNGWRTKGEVPVYFEYWQPSNSWRAVDIFHITDEYPTLKLCMFAARDEGMKC